MTMTHAKFGVNMQYCRDTASESFWHNFVKFVAEVYKKKKGFIHQHKIHNDLLARYEDNTF